MVYEELLRMGETYPDPLKCQHDLNRKRLVARVDNRGLFFEIDWRLNCDRPWLARYTEVVTLEKLADYVKENLEHSQDELATLRWLNQHWLTKVFFWVRQSPRMLVSIVEIRMDEAYHPEGARRGL